MLEFAVPGNRLLRALWRIHTRVGLPLLGRLVSRPWFEVGRFLGGVPGLLSRGAVLVEQLDAITRNGLVLAPETVADIGRAEARRNRWMTVALWLIANGYADVEMRSASDLDSVAFSDRFAIVNDRRRRKH